MTFAVAKPSAFAVAGALPAPSRRFRMTLGVTEPAALTAVIVAFVIVPTPTGVTPIGFVIVVSIAGAASGSVIIVVVTAPCTPLADEAALFVPTRSTSASTLTSGRSTLIIRSEAAFFISARSAAAAAPVARGSSIVIRNKTTLLVSIRTVA